MGLKKTIKEIGEVGLFIGALGLAYQCCFAPRTVEDVTITKTGTYEIEDIDTGYYEEQNTIHTDNKQCFRAPKPFGEGLEVGDKLSTITYRPAIFGRCDFVREYER